jgi:hypothetical protein
VVAPYGEKNISIKKQGKFKVRATIILLIGYSLDGTPKKGRPFVIFKGRPQIRTAQEFEHYNRAIDSPCFLVF